MDNVSYQSLQCSLAMFRSFELISIYGFVELKQFLGGS